MVYIEVVIFNNFAIDLMLALATLTLRRKMARAYRTLLAAIVGTAAAVYYAIAPSGAQIAIKILLAPALCLILCKAEGKGALRKIFDYTRTLIVFALLTHFVGGIVYGLSHLLKVDLNSYASLGLCASGVVVMLLAARLIARKRTLDGKRECKTQISASGQIVEVLALLDSGNCLVDEVSGLPVVIISKSVESHLLPRDYLGFISVSTAAGESSMPLVKLDGVKVGEREFKALGALAKRDFDGYGVILQNSMF